MTADILRISAPAKVNLALHVTGRRPDGYHDLDSLVAFTGLGDEITLRPAAELSLTVDGPCAAGVPGDAANLALKAALALRERAGDRHPGAHIHLIKNIPPAAGLGGGSADATAVLRGLNQLWELGLDDPALAAIGLTLGADVPVCLYGRPARMQGIGEEISPVSLNVQSKPVLLLVNPGIEIPTKAVFSALEPPFGGPLSAFPENGWNTLDALAGYLGKNRNDLEDAARKRAPVVGEVMAWLRAQPHCHLARMTGSGATCFGLFSGDRPARDALGALKHQYPAWWVCQTPLG